MEKLREELKELCSKHGVEHASFAGEKDGHFLGIICIDVERISEVFQAYMNVGRLWQSARQACKGMLDEFEGKWR